LLKGLSDRPNVDQLEQFLDRLLEQRGDDLEFVVLFGSMARGNWSRDSDYDVLLGLRGEDGQRFTDRLGEFQALVDGNIDVLPYSRSEWQRMVEERRILFLDALSHGIPLWDRGSFAELQRRFQQWRAAGQVSPDGSGWRIQ
jgi:predicted nucleotidyltransferase